MNENVKEILKAINKISNSIIIDNRIVTSDENKNLICAVDIGKIENIPEPIGINDLSQFLNVLGMFKDYTFKFDNGIVYLTDNNTKAEIKYLTSNIDIIDTISYNIVQSTANASSVYSFTLKKDMLEMIKKGKSIFSDADTIVINTENNTLSLTVDESFNQNNNEFTIPIENTICEKETVIKIPIEPFMMIPELDYNVEIKYNEKKKAYRVYMNKSIFEIVMSVKV